MPISKGTLNALNLLGVRKVNAMPKHFTKISIGDFIEIRKIDMWIYTNLNNRYCIRRKGSVDSRNKIINQFQIGFEDAKEATFFMLACPYINKKHQEFL